jgi:hypothetical protein
VIPKVTKHLLSNPVFTCIVLAACMEIAVVAGFAAFLGKYLEQQFNLTTSSANQLLGEWVSFPSCHTNMLKECTELKNMQDCAKPWYMCILFYTRNFRVIFSQLLKTY